MAGVNGNIYTDAQGNNYTYIGAWSPDLVYQNSSLPGEGYPLQSGTTSYVVEYDGAYFKVNYYSEDVNPLEWHLASGTTGDGTTATPNVDTAPWSMLQAPPTPGGNGTVVPQAPGGLTKGYVSSNAITLDWQPAEVHGPGDVGSYEVYATTTPGNPNSYKLVGTTTNTTFTINGLDPNTTYSFEVDAVNVAGVSGKSQPYSATTTFMNSDSGKYFSPYVDLTSPSEDIAFTSKTAGLRDFTIAFMNSAGLFSTAANTPTPNQGNYPNDGSVPTLSLGGATVNPSGLPVLNMGAILDEVQQVESEGGKVTVSVGGYTGRDPAVIAEQYATYLNSGSAAAVGSTAYNTAVANLKSEYQSAASAFDANGIDFDIENDGVPDQEWQAQGTIGAGGYWKEVSVGNDYKDFPSPDNTDTTTNGVVNDTVANVMRDKAIVGLEQANPGLSVSFTLAVTPSGLPTNAEALLSQALADGVRIDTVNVMAMDYDSPTNAQGTSYNDASTGGTAMAVAAEQAAQNTENWLVANGFASTKVGITPMIGQNDSAGEVFTLQDAQALETWAAKQPWVAGLGEWSINRDQLEANNQIGSVSPSESGVAETSANEFASDLNRISQAVSVASFQADQTSLNQISGGFAVGDVKANILTGLPSLQADAPHINSIYSTDAPISVGIGRFQTAQTVLDKVIGGFGISGSAAAIESDIAGIAADGNITSVGAVDGVIAVGVGKFLPDESALNKIGTGFSINGQSSVISSNFDALSADVTHINTLGFADSNPMLKVTAAQLSSDSALLSKVVGVYALDVANPDGTTTITGHGTGLTINATASGGDTITGNGQNDTFVFQSHFGHDTVTDFGSYLGTALPDTIVLPQSEFANFSAMLGDTTYSGSGQNSTATISAANGDQLVLQNVTASTLANAQSDFKFA